MDSGNFFPLFYSITSQHVVVVHQKYIQQDNVCSGAKRPKKKKQEIFFSSHTALMCVESDKNGHVSV